MRLLITGAGGMLATAVGGVARRLGHDVLALSHAELDVCDAEATHLTVARSAPAAIVNCAAWTDVDGAETEPAGAHAVNADGAGNVARAAAQVGVHLVHVSTDYVFDGESRRPYVESDPPAPRCAYGAGKLDGERQVLDANAGHAVVRSSWLFGAGGRNFVDTMLDLGAQRQEISVVCDQVGCPTWTDHLGAALVEIAERRERGVRHLAAQGSCSWNELAVEIFDQAAIDCRVLPTTTEAMGRPAPRPAYSVLGSELADALLLPPWTEGLRAYLSQRRVAESQAGAGPAS